MNIQVNGTEIEALNGLQRYFDRVKVIRVYCSSLVNTESAVRVRKLFAEKGCEIISNDRPGGQNIVAVTPSYIGAVKFFHGK